MAKVAASKERVKKVYHDLLSGDFITLTAENTSKDKSIILIKWLFFNCHMMSIKYQTYNSAT